MVKIDKINFILYLVFFKIFLVFIFKLWVCDIYPIYYCQKSNSGYVITSIFSIIFVALFFRTRCRNPIDIFIAIQVIFLYIPLLFYLDFNKEEHFLLGFISLFILFALMAMRYIIVSVAIKAKIIRFPYMPSFIILMNLFFLAYFANYLSVDIVNGLENSYLNRLFFYDNISTLEVYAYTIFSYCFVPLFAMVAALKYNYWIALTCSLFLTFIIFFISGEKFNIFNVLFIIYVTKMLRQHTYIDMSKIFLLITALAFAASIEIILLSGTSPLNVTTDLGIRRILLSQPLILEYATQFLYEPGWTLVLGSDFGHSYSYLVGERFFGVPNYNPNASVLHLSLLGGGLLEFFIQYFMLFIFMALLQHGYVNHNNPVCQIIALYLSLLSLEQPFTTMLMTSGFAFMLLLTFIIWEKRSGHCGKV